jgi:hypothetical protein
VLKNDNGDIIGTSTILFGRSNVFATEYKAILDKLPLSMKNIIIQATSDLEHPASVAVLYDINGVPQAVIRLDLPDGQVNFDEAMRQLNEEAQRSGKFTPAPPRKPAEAPVEPTPPIGPTLGGPGSSGGHEGNAGVGMDGTGWEAPAMGWAPGSSGPQRPDCVEPPDRIVVCAPKGLPIR